MKIAAIIPSLWLRRSALALAALLGLWALAWLIVPPVLKNQLETRLGAQLGREVRVGQVDFKPWSLELAVHDLVIAQAQAQVRQPQLSIKRLYLNLEAQSLWRLAPVLDALQIEAPHLHLRHQGGGRYDVDDVLARLKPAPGAPATDPLHFALYNLVLTQGAVTFDDAAHGQRHQLTEVTIQLPFLSNLASQRQVLVQPQLAFKINGSAFDSGAQGTPFADNHASVVNFSLKQLDLAPWLGYWPAGLPLRLGAGVLDAELKLTFEQAAKTSVRLSGRVTASRVQLTAPASAGLVATAPAEMLAFETLTVQLADVRPLEQRVQLGQIDWVRPVLHLQRSAQGRLNWQTLLEPPKAAANTSKNIAISAGTASATGQKEAKPATWQVALAQFNVQGADLRWRDLSTAKPTQLALHGLDVSVQALHWPLTASVPFAGSGQLEGAALTFQGQASDQSAEVQAQLTQMPLALAAPYLADVLNPRLNGLLSADLALNWAAASAAQSPMRLTLRLPKLTLAQLALLDRAATASGRATPLASMAQVQLTGSAFDLVGQTARLGELQISQAKVALARNADGRWMFEDWLTAPAAPATPTSPAAPDTPAAKPWAVSLQQLKLVGSQVAFTDALPVRPVAWVADELSLQVKDLSSTGQQPFAWTLEARLRHEQSAPGRLSAQGSTTLSPLALQAQLSAKGLPLMALEPYAGEALKLRLVRGQAGFTGRVELASQLPGLAAKINGDVLLQDLRADTLASTDLPAEELLSWRELSLTGLALAVQPGQAPRIDVAQTALSDFFAKLTLTERGRLNLQEVRPAAEDNSKSVAASAGGISATAQNDINSDATPSIRFGPLSLVNGRVDFTDRFIRPNYLAHLTELNGTLGGFSSQPVNGAVQLADLSLRGRVEGTATLEVVGRVNPLARPLALDITGRVRDLELAPLSPYAGRYAGYGIERGKLSVDIRYKVQPDGQLSADHNIVLNQLKFGAAVPGAENSLPVKLAVALLADSQGVIDINLPVSGSLGDPQFRLAPIVFRLIGSLIMKAITAPFSLLASALGGGSGDELSRVAFEPGSAALSQQARAQLDKVAKALLARPALKMTVTGTASLQLEAEAFSRHQLQALLLAEKRQRQPKEADVADVADGANGADIATVANGANGADGADGADVADVANGATVVSAQELPELLKAVYQRADFAKPRNLLGLTKDLPVPDMQALLLAHLKASESAMQALAVQRGTVVRDHLASLKLPLSRLFLGAAKAVAPETKWQPHAELSLADD